MKNPAVLVLAGSIAMATLLGCGPATVGTAVDSIAARGKAESVAERYFSLARAREWREIEGLYASEFYEAMPRETWRRILPNVDRELGRLGECTQTRWNVQKKVGTDFTGTIVDLVYECQHERYPASVSFAIARPTGSSEFEIRGQNFNSLGFLIE